MSRGISNQEMWNLIAGDVTHVDIGICRVGYNSTLGIFKVVGENHHTLGRVSEDGKTPNEITADINRLIQEEYDRL